MVCWAVMSSKERKEKHASSVHPGGHTAEALHKQTTRKVNNNKHCSHSHCYVCPKIKSSFHLMSKQCSIPVVVCFEVLTELLLVQTQFWMST